MPPMTLYGNAPGATPGQRVLALVSDGVKTTVCSNDPAYDTVLLFEGRVVYRVSVVGADEKSGCGAAGRQVTLYFVPGAGADGRAAMDAIAWQRTTVEQNVTLSPALTNKGYAPVMSRDGYN